jgi:hypothetical protein
MDLLKGMAGKIMTGVVALAVVVGAITWWSMDPASRQAILAGMGRIIAWFGIVVLLPWATFFVIAPVARRESNLAAGMLVAAYTLLELALLIWLFEWNIDGAAAWTFVCLGCLVAAVYNVFTCDWIAEKVA